LAAYWTALQDVSLTLQEDVLDWEEAQIEKEVLDWDEPETEKEKRGKEKRKKQSTQEARGKGGQTAEERATRKEREEPVETERKTGAEKKNDAQKEEQVKGNLSQEIFLAAGMGDEQKLPLKEAAFKNGELMEVVGLKNKPDYNGKFVRVMKYDSVAGRYEVQFEGGCYNTVAVKLREVNFMHPSMAQQNSSETQRDDQEELEGGFSQEILDKVSEQLQDFHEMFMNMFGVMRSEFDTKLEDAVSAINDDLDELREVEKKADACEQQLEDLDRKISNVVRACNETVRDLVSDALVAIDRRFKANEKMLSQVVKSCND